MKPKGINFFEQHVEKIVVGVLGAAALGVIAMQFVGRQNTVTVNNRPVAPDQAYELLRREAETVRARLRETSVPESAPTSVPALSADMERVVTAGVSPAPMLSAPLTPPMLVTSIGTRSGFDDADAPKFAPLRPPAPTRPVAAVVGGALDPLIVARHPALASLTSSEQPYDLRAVSVQATFPAAAMVAALEATPRDAGKQTIPRFYWMNRLEVLDVVLERQEALPDGRYGSVEVVSVMPGAPSLREQLSEEGIPASALQMFVNHARDNRRGMVRPAFYPTVAGEAWRPPEFAVAAASASEAPGGQLDTLRRRLDRLDREIESVEARLQAAPRSSTDRAAPASAGAVAGVGPARGSPGRAPSRDSAQSEQDRRRAADQERLATLRMERDRVVEEIATLDAGPTTGVSAEAERLMTEPVGSLEAVESMSFWTHDVTATPGRAYRYRVRVGVTNPLFGNPSNLAEDDADAALSPVAMSEPSAWSDVVRIEPATQMFVVGAAQPGLGAGGEASLESPVATVEVYHFHYGHWRRATVRMTPGDAISVDVRVPSLPLFVLDTEGDAPRVVGREDGPASVPVRLDAFLVDVVESSTMDIAGQARTQWQAVFRDEAGRLIVRTPEADRGSSTRRALEASAVRGESAGVSEPGSGFAASTPRAPGARPAAGGQQQPQTQRQDDSGGATGGRPGRVD